MDPYRTDLEKIARGHVLRRLNALEKAVHVLEDPEEAAAEAKAAEAAKAAKAAKRAGKGKGK